MIFGERKGHIKNKKRKITSTGMMGLVVNSIVKAIKGSIPFLLKKVENN